jgi:hypothetical protein
MILRRPFRETKSLKERLLAEARTLREEARMLPNGPLRDAALRKARQTEAAAHMDDWLNSPGLRPPTRDYISTSLSDAERIKRFRDKAAEAEQLIGLAQTEARRQTLGQIADSYNRSADHLEALDRSRPKKGD